MIRKVESWLQYDFSGKCVLVVGAGTGAESIVLASRGAKVYGIEPDDAALSILRSKARLHNLRCENFISGVAEDIPFPDDLFDFVYCYTVLEHMKDVQRSIDEMIRVCKTGGLVFIQTPDYRFPNERHYKLAMIPFAPRWIQKLYFVLRRRPTEFLSSVNFLTEPKLNRIFWKRNVITIRIYEPVLSLWSRRSINYWFSHLFNVTNQQYVFLRKMPHPRRSSNEDRTHKSASLDFTARPKTSLNYTRAELPPLAGEYPVQLSCVTDSSEKYKTRSDRAAFHAWQEGTTQN